MTSDDDSDHFPETFQGAEIRDPALSDAEWDQICSAHGVALSHEVRSAIDEDLWWCAWSKGNLTAIPRPAALRHRLSKFIRGADLALSGIGYLEAAGLKSATDQPPVGVRVRKLPDAQAWLGLRNAAMSKTWGEDGFRTRRALDQAGGPDAALWALHALAFAAGRALVEWEHDKGGQRSGGDLHFIKSLLVVLRAAGVDVRYEHDRSDEGVGMQGVAWDILIAIWSLRPEAFVAGEQSTLGTYYRKSYRDLPRNEPA